MGDPTWRQVVVQLGRDIGTFVSTTSPDDLQQADLGAVATFLQDGIVQPLLNAIVQVNCLAKLKVWSITALLLSYRVRLLTYRWCKSGISEC
jgi:hypothetical protein